MEALMMLNRVVGRDPTKIVWRMILDGIEAENYRIIQAQLFRERVTTDPYAYAERLHDKEVWWNDLWEESSYEELWPGSMYDVMRGSPMEDWEQDELLGLGYSMWEVAMYRPTAIAPKPKRFKRKN